MESSVEALYLLRYLIGRRENEHREQVAREHDRYPVHEEDVRVSVWSHGRLDAKDPILDGLWQYNAEFIFGLAVHHSHMLHADFW